MDWDWLSFGIFTGGFFMLSASKTYQKFKLTMNPPKQVAVKTVENQNTTVQKSKFNTRKYIKQIINYCVAYNSSILIVGSLSESYISSLTMMGNILAITLGYIYALIFVHPFTYSLEKEIKTPYQYFEKRYKNKYVRSICALMAIFYQFSFISLFLWGCTIVLCTLIPALPFWVSILILGLYSLVGSSFGGYVQATLTNLLQFLIVIIGILTALILTLSKSKNTFEELWNFAKIHERTNFIELRTDMKIRFTLLNQLVSLPLSWCAVHSLLLPSFIRYRAVEGKIKSKIMLVSNLPIMVIFYVIILMSGGFVCYLFFYGCDPFKSHKILSKNQTGVFWVYLVLSKYAPSFTGILFSSVICYSIVQHSSGLCMCANTLVDEVFRPVFSRLFLTEHDVKRIKLLITISFGFISILYAFLFHTAKNTLLSLLFLFNNSTNSPILGLFLLSVFNPYANAFGAISGFLINLILNYWFVSGALLISKESPANVALCNTNNPIVNYENFDYSNLTVYYTQGSLRAANNSKMHEFYLKNYPQIHFIFSLPAIWYCLFSILTTFILGSIFSVIYSILTTKSFDSDSYFSEERKNYLYYYRVFKNIQKKRVIEGENCEKSENIGLLKKFNEH